MPTEKKHSSKPEDLSRRQFCRNTAITTSGLLALPITMEAFAYPAGSEVLKLAVVGCGGRGSGAVVQALTADEQVELVAMADAFEDRLEDSLAAIQEHFGAEKKVEVPKAHRFTGFEAYKQAIDLADVVILATPPGFRPLHFEYAVAQGKHIFMEKPVATDPVGVRRVLEAAKVAKEKQLNVVVGLQRHYENKYLDLYKRVQDGAIGQIVAGQIYWNDDGVWVRKRQPGQTEMEYQMRNWYYFNWLCGDHILEQHIHNIDVANWFVGDYPATAQGMGGRQIRTGKDHGEIFDHHFVEFTYPNGAVIASQCRHQKGCMFRIDEVFQGTQGTLEIGKGAIRDLTGATAYTYANSWEEDPNPYQVEHDRLFASIRSGGLISDAENGAKSTLTAIMGRMATYSGDVITWEQVMNSDLQLVQDELDWETNPPTLPDASGYYSIPTPGKTKYS